MVGRGLAPLGAKRPDLGGHTGGATAPSQRLPARRPHGSGKRTDPPRSLRGFSRVPMADASPWGRALSGVSFLHSCSPARCVSLVLKSSVAGARYVPAAGEEIGRLTG